jgi:hypothetical protein
MPSERRLGHRVTAASARSTSLSIGHFWPSPSMFLLPQASPWCCEAHRLLRRFSPTPCLRPRHQSSSVKPPQAPPRHRQPPVAIRPIHNLLKHCSSSGLLPDLQVDGGDRSTGLAPLFPAGQSAPLWKPLLRSAPHRL